MRPRKNGRGHIMLSEETIGERLEQVDDEQGCCHAGKTTLWHVMLSAAKHDMGQADFQ